MKCDRLLPTIIGVLLLTSLAVTGCGKKGDPVPYRAKPLPVITDLRVSPGPAGIEVRWSLPATGEITGNFKITRSERSPDGTICAGCPQEYLPIGIVPAGNERKPASGERSLAYTDADVKAGHRYSYRVAVCTPDGLCGATSSEAGVLYEQR